MGNSINQYINNFKIILYTKLLVGSLVTGNTANYYTIKFNASGQYIDLVSIFNVNNKYYHLLNNTIFQKTIITNVQNNIKTIIDNNITTANSLNQYSDSELNKIEIMIFNKNINNIVSLTKKYTIIELNEKLTSDIYILIPNLTVHGVEKNIILGKSIDQFINNHNIIIYSKYVDLEGRGPLFLNLKLFKSGQLLKLVSVIHTETDDQINKYWQILMGTFESSDEIRFNSLGNYVNTTTDGETYNIIVDDSFYAQPTDLHIYQEYTDVSMHANITIKEKLNIQKDLNLSNINFSITPSLPSNNTNTMIYTADNLYFNHNNKWVTLLNQLTDTLFIQTLSNNNIPINTNSTLIQFSIPLTSSITINLPTSTNYGQEKTILLGDSIGITNTHEIQIKSTFLGGYSTYYFNTVTTNALIKFINPGQCIKLMAMRSSQNIDYWHILSGNFTT